jgi:hypothetical protein
MDSKEGKLKKQRLINCIIVNGVLFTSILIFIVIFQDAGNKYLRFGPNNDLDVLGIKINNWKKYIIFQLFLAVVQMTNVYINEIASPIFGFTIYNPDKKEITEFGRLELQIYANSMWLLNSLRSVMFVVVSISQIDIALLQTFYGELMSFYTIRMLLLEKTFPEDKKIVEYELIKNMEIV